MDKFDWALGGVFGGLVIASGLYIGIPYSVGKNPRNMLPRSAKLEEGFVDPSNVKIDYRDDNENGKAETVFMLGETNYHLKLDENGRPYFQTFLVDPAEKPKIVTGDYDSRKRGLEKSVSDK